MDISVKDYMSMQPNYPKVADSDKYYLQMTLRLAEAFDRTGLFANIDESTRRNVVLAVIGYYQDVVSDCGIWRSFITIHKQFYGSPLPFYTPDDNYCESELNRDDIRFIIWYVLECHSTEYGLLSPFNADILELANLFFRILDEEYLKAPNPMEYIMAMDVELDNLGQAQTIFELSSWLFWNSYLMRHAARGAIEEAHTEAREIIARHAKPADAAPKLSDLNDRVMLSNPTGPLALTVGEWIKAIVDGVLPEQHEDLSNAATHKFYTQLHKATQGKDIAFFDSYDALEAFLSDDMQWGQCAEGHLPHLRHADNFVVFGTRTKGILIAQNVAQYIKHPDNCAYDAALAASEGYQMLTTRGACPIDLLKHAFSNGLLSDLRLPYDPDGNILNGNWDFLARLYQQRYYRPD